MTIFRIEKVLELREEYDVASGYQLYIMTKHIIFPCIYMCFRQTTEDDCNDGEELYAQADFNNLWEESFDENAEDKLSIWKIRNKEATKLAHVGCISFRNIC